MIDHLETIPTIDTEHYTLRGLDKKDSETLFAFLSDRETMRFITSNPVQTVQEVEEKVEQQLTNFKVMKEIPWVIVEKQSKRVIGLFRFHKLRTWHQSTELGVVLHREYQQKGVMTEVLPQMLYFGFRVLGVNRIVGDIFAGNQGSQKLLERLGFTKEGVLRQTEFDGSAFYDTVVYALLKDAYKESTSPLIHPSDEAF